MDSEEAQAQNEQGAESSTSKVFRNKILINLIMKYADANTIKSLSRLNKLWAAETAPEFPKRFVVVLKLGSKITDVESFTEQTKFMQPIKKLVIRTDILTPPSRAFLGMYLPPKWVGLDENETELLDKIMETLSPDLEALDITVERKLSGMNRETHGIFFPGESIQLPKLSKLSISNCGLNIAQRYPWMYKNLPNLQELVIQELGIPEYHDFVLAPLLNEDGSRNFSVAPRLVGLTITKNFFPSAILTLINFPQAWEKLDLCWLYLVDSSTVLLDHFSRLLLKNKDALKFLKIREFRWQNTITAEHWRNAELKFPVCPNLEILEIEILGVQYNSTVDITFGGGTLDYCKNFPEIKTLNIAFKGWENSGDLEKFWKIFFPKQVCKTLQSLELNVGACYSDYLQCYGEKTFWYKDIFPNASVKIL